MILMLARRKRKSVFISVFIIVASLLPILICAVLAEKMPSVKAQENFHSLTTVRKKQNIKPYEMKVETMERKTDQQCNHSKSKKRPYKINATSQQQEIIDYAWDFTGSVEFIYTLEAENCSWDIDAVSKRNKDGSYDFGICQLNSKYHQHFIRSTKFHDYREQIRYCWEVFKEPERKGRLKTTFYGYQKIHRAKNSFIWK